MTEEQKEFYEHVSFPRYDDIEILEPNCSIFVTDIDSKTRSLVVSTCCSTFKDHRFSNEILEMFDKMMKQWETEREFLNSLPCIQITKSGVVCLRIRNTSADTNSRCLSLEMDKQSSEFVQNIVDSVTILVFCLLVIIAVMIQ